MAGYNDRDNSPPRRGRDQQASSSASSSKPRGRQTDDNDNDELPQPFDAKKLAPAKKRGRSPPPSEGARRRKRRPGRPPRIPAPSREKARGAAGERERALEGEAPAVDARRNVINDVVRAHYN